MTTSTKQMIQEEIMVLDEVIEVLVHPPSYSIKTNNLFNYFNLSLGSNNVSKSNYASSQVTTSASTISISSASAKSVTGTEKVVVKVVDFNNFIDLGYKLSESNLEIMQCIKLLSTNVYINNLSGSDMTHINSMLESLSVSSSALPTDNDITLYYLPDLRLVIKNVLILFINFLKKQENIINSPAEPMLYNLVLLLNVSIVNKLVKIFKTLNSQLDLKSEKLIPKLMT